MPRPAAEIGVARPEDEPVDEHDVQHDEREHDEPGQHPFTFAAMYTAIRHPVLLVRGRTDQRAGQGGELLIVEAGLGQLLIYRGTGTAYVQVPGGASRILRRRLNCRHEFSPICADESSLCCLITWQKCGYYAMTDMALAGA